ncbi:MAG: hypothetical protein AB8F65_07640 [Woeseiaceae bacterium]
MSDKDFFIGWAETPDKDRRFLLRAGVALMAGTAGIAGFVAGAQRPVGKGTWDLATFRDFEGVVTSSPYPMLRTCDIDGTPRTVMLACQTKCGVDARLKNFGEGAVVINGSLIQRGNHAMITVSDEADWIRASDKPVEPALLFATPTLVGDVELAGEILDSKCWFGAMRPSEGKVHKACASLCIRGGIPPAFFARDAADNPALLIVTEDGRRFSESMLAYVADPISLKGQVSRSGDLWLLDISASNVNRV